MSSLLKVVVEPAEEDFLWREGEEITQALALLQQDSQVGAVL